MCVFCKIVKGEIPAFKIHETKDVLAFLDLSQVTIGHTLVIPKKHCENLLALDDELSSILLKEVVLVAKKLKKKLNVDALNVVNNCGEVAGQSVMHIHFHLIPRTKGDEFEIKQVVHEPNFDELRKLCEKINKED